MAVRIIESSIRIVGGSFIDLSNATAIAVQTPITPTGVSQQSAAFNGLSNRVLIEADETVHVAFGPNPTATTGHAKIAAGTFREFVATPGDKVAVITGTGGSALDAILAGTVPATAPGTASTSAVTTQGNDAGIPVPVGSPGTVFTFTPTLDTSAYAVGDVLFAVANLANFVRANDQRAFLTSLTVIDKAKQKVAFDLYFFATNVTSLGAANAVNALSDADALSIIGRVSIVAGDYVDLANNSNAVKSNIGKLLRSVSGARNVYVGAVITAGTPTFAAGDLQLVFDVLWS